MAECLGSVAQLLPRAGNLLGEHAQVISKGHHVLKHAHGLDEVFFLVDACAGEGFDQPECAHGEGAFATADT